MNIVVVEDSELIRDQLLRVIAQEPQMHVIGTASEEQEAIRLILDKQPDAVLLDLALAPGSGIGVLEKIREAGSKTQVLVLSNYIGNALHDACSLLGISGFYDKSSQIKECLEHLVRMPTPARCLATHDALMQLPEPDYAERPDRPVSQPISAPAPDVRRHVH